MANPMNSAVSGMDSAQQWMAVVGNNISNMNTVGFKASEVNFEDLLSQTLSKGAQGSTTTTGIGGTNPLQVGTGVSVGAITPNFSEGSLNNTGNSNDLAISGNGFFVVSPNSASSVSTTGTTGVPTPAPPSTGPFYYTRAGNFSVDSNGYLVDPNGNYLMASTSPITTATATPSLTAVNVHDLTTGQPSSFTVGANGTITVQNGTTYYLALANVSNPGGLVSVGNNNFTAPTGGNSGTPQYDQPGNGNNGTIQQGFLESSNVDLTQEMSNMIQAQTMYDGNSKMIQTVSSMNQFMLQQV